MSSISGVGGGYGSMMMQGTASMRGMRRPDPTEMANDLFSKLDTSGQGYIEIADLQNAFDKSPSKVNASGSSTSADDLFSQLDADGDGKITKQEFSDSVSRLAEQLEQQFQSGRMQGAMPQMGNMGGMPPGPPPGGGEDRGMTKEELTSAAEQVSGNNSNLSNLLSDIVQNFAAADTNEDGKVTMQETIAYQQSQSTAEPGTATNATAEDAGATASGSDNFEARLMMQIMKLANAYGIGREGSAAATSSLLVTV